MIYYDQDIRKKLNSECESDFATAFICTVCGFVLLTMGAGCLFFARTIPHAIPFVLVGISIVLFLIGFVFYRNYSKFQKTINPDGVFVLNTKATDILKESNNGSVVCKVVCKTRSGRSKISISAEEAQKIGANKKIFLVYDANNTLKYVLAGEFLGNRYSYDYAK